MICGRIYDKYIRGINGRSMSILADLDKDMITNWCVGVSKIYTWLSSLTHVYVRIKYIDLRQIYEKRLFNVFVGRSMINSLVIEKIINGFMDGS